MNLSRRALLASTAAFAVTPAFAAMSGPPVAPVRPVTETLWGVKVTDRYRWMEAETPEWKQYALAEGAYTESVLGSIPGRDALAAAIGKNTGEITAVLGVQTGGTKIFTEVRPAGAALSKLYVREGLAGADRLLLDPAAFTVSGSHSALDWWAPSPDGSHLVAGISPGGSEQSTMHFLVTDTGKFLPETIDRTADAAPSWLPDGAGLFYNRLQDVPPSSESYEEDSACWLHMLGTDPASDKKILAKGLSKLIPMQDLDMPIVSVTPGSSIVIGAVISGVQNEMALYATTFASAAAGTPNWTKICDPVDDVTGFAVLGEAIYLLTHKHAPRYKIVKTTGANPAIAHAVEVVPQSSAVLRDIVAASDAIYILELNAGLSGLRRLAPDGSISTLKLPFTGAIEDNSEGEAFYADTLHAGCWFMLEGWVHPTTVCHAAADGTVTPTNLAPAPPINLSPYISEEVFADARDGTRIPLSIVYRKNFVRNGKAPLLLEAYGAYGISEDPGFIARWLPFLDRGGVFAVAHVRGGGELGEDWHKAGQKLQKFHSWEDMIDCAEALIRGHWTSHRRLAIIGGSAGGITVGRFLTERPDLAAVVISAVGVSNPLREEFSPNGPPNIPEFGSVSTEAGFRGLYAMDAYQHVHDGVKYPSILLTTGLNDPRVPSWDPTKMTARLQAATASANPVLLRVDTDAGHGFGSTRAQRDNETADMMAFILWRTGDPRFQPKG